MTDIDAAGPMNAPRTALVTGGAGFIGSHLVDALVERGLAVCVLDDLSTGHRENLAHLAARIRFLEADLRDAGACHRATTGVDVVFHLAALASVTRSMDDPVLTHDVNVTGTLTLLQACRRNGVRRVVFSSSSSVYGDAPTLPKREEYELEPRSPYAVSKLAGEQYVLAFARAGFLEGVALRYFNIFGPRQDPAGPYAAVVPLLLAAAASGRPFTILGDGGQTRDFTHVRNAVHANLCAAWAPAAQCNGAVVNVGAGERTSLRELVHRIEEVSGRAIDLHFGPARAGDVRDSLAALDRAEARLGYSVQVPLAEGLRETWEWATAGSRPEFSRSA